MWKTIPRSESSRLNGALRPVGHQTARESNEGVPLFSGARRRHDGSLKTAEALEFLGVSQNSPTLIGEWKKKVEGVDCRFKLVRSDNGGGGGASTKIVLFSKSREGARTNAKLFIQFVDEVISIPAQEKILDRLQTQSKDLASLDATIADQKKNGREYGSKTQTAGTVFERRRA